MKEGILKVIEESGLTKDSIDLIIPHQANGRILKTILERLGIPEDKMFINISKYGNTATASLVIALAEAVQQGRIKDGDIVVFSAFGAGFSWAVAMMRW